MTALRAQDGVAARALEFLLLTAARTGEVVGAQPDKIKDKVWMVPASRMKANKERRVPLSKPALAIIEKLRKEHRGTYPGGKRNKPLSNMAILALPDRMNR
jgi:integrase